MQDQIRYVAGLTSVAGCPFEVLRLILWIMLPIKYFNSQTARFMFVKNPLTKANYRLAYATAHSPKDCYCSFQISGTWYMLLFKKCFAFYFDRTLESCSKLTLVVSYTISFFLIMGVLVYQVKTSNETRWKLTAISLQSKKRYYAVDLNSISA